MEGHGKWYYPDEADYSGYYKKTYPITQFIMLVRLKRKQSRCSRIVKLVTQIV